MFLYIDKGTFVFKIIWAILIFLDSWPEQSSCRVSENHFYTTVSEKSGISFVPAVGGNPIRFNLDFKVDTSNIMIIIISYCGRWIAL